MNVTVADRFTGDSGLFSVETLADEMTNLQSSETERLAYVALQEALLTEDWTAVAELAETLGIDVEFA